jgi:putative membrane protein insertion efficiency factor
MIAKLIQTAVLVSALILVVFCPVQAEDMTTNRDHKSSQEHAVPFALRVYQKYISGVGGDRCSMYPSCSHYSSQAFARHGVLKGWIMTCDRLMRCGRDEVTLSPPIVVNGRLHAYDPLDNNDIWKEKKTTCCPQPLTTP